MLTTRFKNVGAVATGDWTNAKTIKQLKLNKQTELLSVRNTIQYNRSSS